jgi:hypothetical protein
MKNIKMKGGEKRLEKYKYPLEYELNPSEIEKGSNWITLKLKNIGNETLSDLDVQLHSVDTYNLSVFGSWFYGAGQFIAKLEPNEEKDVLFRVNAVGSADVYATIKMSRDGKYFLWESSWTLMHVSDEKAHLESLLVLSNPYTTIGKTISAEATIKGLRKNGGLKLEFWVETPSGKNEQQAAIDIKELPVGEKSRYTAEFTPKETGRYSVYAYLYDGWKRIDRKMNYIFAMKQ